MERLGEDVIFSIFERISNKEEKKSFSLVCKIFLRVACFHLRSFHTNSPNLLFDILIGSPKMFTFECDKLLSNNHMKLIAESCPNIKYLRLSRLTKQHLDHEVGKLDFDDVGLCAIANACIHLDFVDLSGRLRFTETGIGSLVRSCKNLRKLWLNGCVNVTNKSLKMMGEATRLEELELYCCHSITDLDLEYLANGKFQHCLETLYLYMCDRITDNGIIHLKKLVSLRTLSLSLCGANITDYGVVALCELPNLGILHLDFLINVTDISLREIGSKCLKMQVLCLMGCNRITGVGLHAFYGHQTLLSLTLLSSYNFSLEDVKPLLCPAQISRIFVSVRVWKSWCHRKEYKEYNDTNTHRCQICWGWPSALDLVSSRKRKRDV